MLMQAVLTAINDWMKAATQSMVSEQVTLYAKAGRLSRIYHCEGQINVDLAEL
jgi:hypothetical protein